jgi:NhaP-type Na+/H+ or K+/H+ antiporter
MGLVFILLGFQVRGVLREISDVPTSRLLLAGAIVPLTVIVTRLLWIFPAAGCRAGSPGGSAREIPIRADACSW